MAAETSVGGRVLYEDFPPGIVAVRAVLLVMVAVLGTVLGLSLGWPFALGYLVLYLAVFLGIAKTTCGHCRYYGRVCDSGLSRVGTALSSCPGDTSEYPRRGRRATPPLFAALLTPFLLGGLGLGGGAWVLPALAAYGVVFAMVVATTRYLACPHCVMRDICPMCMDRD